MAKKLTKDVIERVAWTAVQTGLGTLTIESATGTDTLKAALTAAALSGVKGIAAARIGDKESASTVELTEEGGT